MTKRRLCLDAMFCQLWGCIGQESVRESNPPFHGIRNITCEPNYEQGDNQNYFVTRFSDDLSRPQAHNFYKVSSGPVFMVSLKIKYLSLSLNSPKQIYDKLNGVNQSTLNITNGMISPTHPRPDETAFSFDLELLCRRANDILRREIPSRISDSEDFRKTGTWCPRLKWLAVEQLRRTDLLRPKSVANR